MCRFFNFLRLEVKPHFVRAWMMMREGVLAAARAPPLRMTVNSSVRPPALQRSRHHQSCFHHHHHSEDHFDHRHYHCSQCCMLEEGLVWIPFHSGRPNDLLFPPPSRPNCT